MVLCVHDIQEKQQEMSEELGKDQQSVAILQRKHVSFQSDLSALGQQVCLLIISFLTLVRQHLSPH